MEIGNNSWRVDDVIGDGEELNFSQPFLPEALARVTSLEFLSSGEQLTLNQIRANSYLCMFELVQGFILPFVLDHARPRLRCDDERARALLQFASEEAKHIQLFKRFRARFESGFGHRCEAFGHAGEWGLAVLAHHPLAVALAALQIQWTTQQHYHHSAAEERDLDPLFTELLERHWLEGAAHAELNTLMVLSIANDCDPLETAAAMREYEDIVHMIDDVLRAQVQLDITTLTNASGFDPTVEQRQQFMAQQRQANRWSYLGSGMTHPEFLAALERIAPASRATIEQLALTYC
jgi:hypothetical protein